MITNNGKLHIKKYLAGFVPQIGQSIYFGIGAAAENLSDRELNFSATGVNVNLVTFDYISNKLIFKASVPTGFVGKIYEIGLNSGNYLNQNIDSGSKVITTFDSEDMTWDLGGSGSLSYSSTNTRIGTRSLVINGLTNANVSASNSGLFIDLSQNSGADIVKLALNIVDNNTNFVGLRFRTSGGSYFQYAWDVPVRNSGYKILEATKDSFSPIGSTPPSWDNITSILVYTVSKTTGAGVVEFDSIRIEDRSNLNTDNVLVARKVLSSPVVSLDGQAQDIEFSLDINI